jgi:hypothetical protein
MAHAAVHSPLPPQRRANCTGTESVNAFALAPNASSTSPLVELHVSARGLKDMDTITVSDPICVLFIPSGNLGENSWKEVARTEVIWNNLNPDWVTYFTVMYVFEVRQPLMFRVYDVDSANAELSAHDFIGEAQLELSQIISGGVPTEVELKHPTQGGFRGTLTIAHEQVENCSSLVKGQFTGVRLKKQRLLFSNDPFLSLQNHQKVDNSFQFSNQKWIVQCDGNRLKSRFKHFVTQMRIVRYVFHFMILDHIQLQLLLVIMIRHLYVCVKVLVRQLRLWIREVLIKVRLCSQMFQWYKDTVSMIICVVAFN